MASTTSPLRFWSGSEIIGAIESDAVTAADGRTVTVVSEATEVGGGATLMAAVVKLSFGSLGSVYFAVTVSPGFTYNLPEGDPESDAFKLNVRLAMSKMPVFLPVSVKIRISVSPVV